MPSNFKSLQTNGVQQPSRSRHRHNNRPTSRSQRFSSRASSEPFISLSPRPLYKVSLNFHEPADPPLTRSSSQNMWGYPRPILRLTSTFLIRRLSTRSQLLIPRRLCRQRQIEFVNDLSFTSL